jgi:hypothetical protein
MVEVAPATKRHVPRTFVGSIPKDIGPYMGTISRLSMILAELQEYTKVKMRVLKAKIPSGTIEVMRVNDVERIMIKPFLPTMTGTPGIKETVVERWENFSNTWATCNQPWFASVVAMEEYWTGVWGNPGEVPPYIYLDNGKMIIKTRHWDSDLGGSDQVFQESSIYASVTGHNEYLERTYSSNVSVSATIVEPPPYEDNLVSFYTSIIAEMEGGVMFIIYYIHYENTPGSFSKYWFGYDVGSDWTGNFGQEIGLKVIGSGELSHNMWGRKLKILSVSGIIISLFNKADVDAMIDWIDIK